MESRSNLATNLQMKIDRNQPNTIDVGDNNSRNQHVSANTYEIPVKSGHNGSLGKDNLNENSATGLSPMISNRESNEFKVELPDYV